MLAAGASVEDGQDRAWCAYCILEQGIIVLLEEGDLKKIIVATGRVICQGNTERMGERERGDEDRLTKHIGHRG